MISPFYIKFMNLLSSLRIEIRVFLTSKATGSPEGLLKIGFILVPIYKT